METPSRFQRQTTAHSPYPAAHEPQPAIHEQPPAAHEQQPAAHHGMLNNGKAFFKGAEEEGVKAGKEYYKDNKDEINGQVKGTLQDELNKNVAADSPLRKWFPCFFGGGSSSS